MKTNLSTYFSGTFKKIYCCVSDLIFNPILSNFKENLFERPSKLSAVSQFPCGHLTDYHIWHLTYIR